MNKELSKYGDIQTQFMGDSTSTIAIYCIDIRCPKFEKMIDWGLRTLQYYIEVADAHIEKYHSTGTDLE